MFYFIVFLTFPHFVLEFNLFSATFLHFILCVRWSANRMSSAQMFQGASHKTLSQEIDMATFWYLKQMILWVVAKSCTTLDG